MNMIMSRADAAVMSHLWEYVVCEDALHNM